MTKEQALNWAKYMFGEEFAWVMDKAAFYYDREKQFVIGYEKICADGQKRSIWMGTGDTWDEAVMAARDSYMRQLSLRITDLEMDKLQRKNADSTDSMENIIKVFFGMKK